MPVQGATHWDALGHVFHEDRMYNGYAATVVDSRGVHRNGIEHASGRMVGRGVLLDVARFKAMEWLPDGYGISNDELDATARPECGGPSGGLRDRPHGSDGTLPQDR